VANGHDEWWIVFWRWIEGAGLAVASASAGGLAWVLRRWRKDSERLDVIERYVNVLREAKPIGRINANSRAIKELRKQIAETTKLTRQLTEQLASLNNCLTGFQGTVANLTSLTELRGKEHHRHVGHLQTQLNRIVRLETKLGLDDPTDIGGRPDESGI
jgi:hypothetical protein